MYSCRVRKRSKKSRFLCYFFYEREYMGKVERYLLVTYMIFMTFNKYENDYSIKIYHLTPRP